MPPTFLIYLFVVLVLPVLLAIGIVFAIGYGVYGWGRRRKRVADLKLHGARHEERP
jgi:hypothetical protein